jgi:tight adherence protein B
MIYVFVFTAAVLLIQTLAGLFFASNDRSRQVNRRMGMLEAGMKHDEVYATLVRKPADAAFDNRHLNTLHERVFTFTRQAGLGASPVRLLIIALSIAVALWLIGLALLSSHKGSDFLANAVVTLLGALALSLFTTWIWVSGRRKARLKRIEEQLPPALDIVNRGIRAGHPVISAVQLAATEMGDPIGSELGLVVDETTYGMEFREALVNLARRTGSPDAQFFAVSVSIQSETGGNLAEILEGLAAVIRGRTTLGKKVKALASEGKASAAILSALPVFLIGTMMLFRPSFYTDKMSDPIFWPSVIIILVVYVIGQFIIRRIVDIRY